MALKRARTSLSTAAVEQAERPRHAVFLNVAAQSAAVGSRISLTAAGAWFGTFAVALLIRFGGDSSSVTMSAFLAASKIAGEKLGSAGALWTMAVIISFSILYFFGRYRRLARGIGGRLEEIIAREAGRLDDARSKGEWEPLPPDAMMEAIERDLERAEERARSAERLGDVVGAEYDRKAVAELWGKYYFADRARRIDLAACLAEALAISPEPSRWIPTRNALRWVERVSTAFSTAALATLFVALVGAQSGVFARVAELRTNDLRLHADADAARRSFEQAVSSLPDDGAPLSDTDRLDVARMAAAYEQRWYTATPAGRAASDSAMPTIHLRAAILREFAASRERRDANAGLHVVSVDMPAEKAARPSTVVGQSFEQTLLELGKRSPARLRSVLVDVRAAGLDEPLPTLSETRMTLLASVVTGATGLVGGGDAIRDIAAQLMDAPAATAARAALDAESLRTAALILNRQTEADLYAAMNPAPGRVSRFAQALDQEAAPKAKTPAVTLVEPAIGKRDSLFDFFFPAAPPSDEAPPVAFARARNSKALEGYADVGGVLLREAAVPRVPLHVVGMKWTIRGREATLTFEQANGTRVSLPPVDAAIVAQSLAVAADGRLVVMTQRDGNAILHPALDGTGLGSRAARLDDFVYDFAQTEASAAQRRVWRQIGLYAEVVSLLGRKGSATTGDLLLGFADGRVTPFKQQTAYYAGGVVHAMIDCAPRDGRALVDCVSQKTSARPENIDLNTVAMRSGVREQEYTVDGTFAFVRDERPFEYVLQLVYTRDPRVISGKGTGESFVDREPWAFPAASAEVAKVVVDRAKRHATCGEIVRDYSAFVRMTRLFRVSLAGGLGEDFPAAKLVRLARETSPFVSTTADITPTEQAPCGPTLPPL
jgi:hypothetical protein